MCMTEKSNQLFLPVGCNRTQNLRFGPYTKRLLSVTSEVLVYNLVKLLSCIDKKLEFIWALFVPPCCRFILVLL